MAIKKSELYSTLWKCCDELRGGMDASQYKDYVLVILFVKYISDKSRNDLNFMIDIPAGCHFEDFVALKGHANIGEEIIIGEFKCTVFPIQMYKKSVIFEGIKKRLKIV